MSQVQYWTDFSGFSIKRSKANLKKLKKIMKKLFKKLIKLLKISTATFLIQKCST